jgi:hypothetical protein
MPRPLTQAELGLLGWHTLTEIVFEDYPAPENPSVRRFHVEYRAEGGERNSPDHRLHLPSHPRTPPNCWLGERLEGSPPAPRHLRATGTSGRYRDLSIWLTLPDGVKGPAAEVSTGLTADLRERSRT